MNRFLTARRHFWTPWSERTHYMENGQSVFFISPHLPYVFGHVSPGGVLPYKGLMGTCGQPGYVFRDFCLKQGIEFIIFCLKQDKCLKQGIKNRNSVLNRVGKSAIPVLNRVRVWGTAPHLPTHGYIEYPPPPSGMWGSRACSYAAPTLLYSEPILGKKTRLFCSLKSERHWR